MSSVSMPVTRPIGRALVVAGASSRSQPLNIMQRLGYTCAEVDNPYAAMLELCRKPAGFQSVILSLASLFREELAIIESIKQRFPQVEIWLTQTDGRHGTLAEAMRLGADGLLSDDGLHRIAMADPPTAAAHAAGANSPAVENHATSEHSNEISEHDLAIGEPVLTADELRALLHEQPSFPPEGA